MANEIELARELIVELVERGRLDLATPRSAAPLAEGLVEALERAPRMEIGEWLVEQRGVSELYADEQELVAAFRPLLDRLAGREPEPAFHPGLVAALEAEPDDLAAWAVYADWLTEQGDPRGELISLQLEREAAREAGREATHLAAKEHAFFSRYRSYFAGTFESGVRFARGYLEEAEVADLGELDALLALESSRFLRDLAVLDVGPLPEAQAPPQRPLPRGLRRLALGTPDDIHRPGKVALGALTAGLARLERVRVSAPHVTLAGLALPSLRELRVQAARLDLAAVELPALEVLALSTYGMTGQKPFRALFERPPERLHHVALAGDLLARFLTPLLASPGAARLRTLELLDVPPASIERVLAARKSLRALSALHVQAPDLPDALLEAVRRAWPFAVAVRDDPLEVDDDEADGDERFEDVAE